MKKAVLLFILIMPVVFAGSASQHGITFNWNGNPEMGRFANGDYWVVGPIDLSSISGADGWQVNVIPGYEVPLSSCSGERQVVVVSSPSLSSIGNAGESILAMIGTSGTACVKTAAVLTVVSEPPPDNGATVFRPPYVGSEKPYYSINDLQTQLLPSLAPVSNTPTLQWVEDRFGPVQTDHVKGAIGRKVHALDYMPDYAPDMAVDHNEAALRLMLNDPIDQKMPGLIAYVQFGIDEFHMARLGQDWPAGGGYTPGKKQPTVFAAVLLNNQEMKDWISNNVGHYHEDNFVYYGQGGVVLFGNPQASSRTKADPYEYIDGAEALHDAGPAVPGESYQFCCLSHPYKGSTLAALLIPEMHDVWNHQEIFDYADRWVTFGVWTLPDPHNRYPELHGTGADSGYRQSNFVNAMWDAYRDLSIESCTGQGYVCCAETCVQPQSGTGCGSDICCAQADCGSVAVTCESQGNYCCPSSMTCNNLVSGDACSGTCCATEADCVDICVSMTSAGLTVEIERWKDGAITIQQIMEAISIWKNGC